MTKEMFPLEVKRVLSRDIILPGTTVDIQIAIRNTTQQPIEELFIIEGRIQPANEIEIFPITDTDSLNFIHQGIITVGREQKFHYSITLHPYFSSEHVTIGEMQVNYSINRRPIQMSIPGTTIGVETLPIEQLEISGGYYNCPNCGESLQLDTVLCTHCGFEINQETLEKIWSTHGGPEKLIEEEIIPINRGFVPKEEKSRPIEEKSLPVDKKPLPIDKEPVLISKESLLTKEKPLFRDNAPLPVEEKPRPIEEKPPKREITHLKKAAQSFQEEKFEECLLGLREALRTMTQSDPTILQNANDAIRRLVINIMEYDGKPISKRTAATSLKFVINFAKSLKMLPSDSPR